MTVGEGTTGGVTADSSGGGRTDARKAKTEKQKLVRHQNRSKNARPSDGGRMGCVRSCAACERKSTSAHSAPDALPPYNPPATAARKPRPFSAGAERRVRECGYVCLSVSLPFFLTLHLFFPRPCRARPKPPTRSTLLRPSVLRVPPPLTLLPPLPPGTALFPPSSTLPPDLPPRTTSNDDSRPAHATYQYQARAYRARPLPAAYDEALPICWASIVSPSKHLFFVSGSLVTAHPPLR